MRFQIIMKILPLEYINVLKEDFHRTVTEHSYISQSANYCEKWPQKIEQLMNFDVTRLKL